MLLHMIGWSLNHLYKKASLTNSMDPDQTAPDLGPHCLLLYSNSSVILGISLQPTTSADDIFKWKAFHQSAQNLRYDI